MKRKAKSGGTIQIVKQASIELQTVSQQELPSQSFLQIRVLAPGASSTCGSGACCCTSCCCL
jgi:hypothetical protein